MFRRLAPLLLLRGIPTATWDDRGDGKDDREVISDDVANLLSDVANLLLDRAADANGDGDETRRVAAELHGRASPRDAAPPRLDRLADAVRAGAWSSARACMFAWCAAFAARGADATVDATFAERLRETLADAAAATSRRPESHAPGSEARVKVDEEDVVKTKTGAMETLAAMARAELEHPRGEAAESDDDDDDDDDIRGSETLEGALAALSAERRGSAPAWTRAAGLATTANVVVSIARRPFARAAAARAFADIALPRLAAAASRAERTRTRMTRFVAPPRSRRRWSPSRRPPGCLPPGCLPPGCLPPGCLPPGCLPPGCPPGRLRPPRRARGDTSRRSRRRRRNRSGTSRTTSSRDRRRRARRRAPRRRRRDPPRPREFPPETPRRGIRRGARAGRPGARGRRGAAPPRHGRRHVATGRVARTVAATRLNNY